MSDGGTYLEGGNHARVVRQAGYRPSRGCSQGVPNRQISASLAESSHSNDTGAAADIGNIHTAFAQSLSIAQYIKYRALYSSSGTL